MTATLHLDLTSGVDPIQMIAEEVFSAMIDGEPGHLQVRLDPPPVLVDELHAWVDVTGEAFTGRVLLSTGTEAADALTRALLDMAPEEPVTDADRADAFGEIANVVGGNVKALVPDTGVLTLPEVSRTRPRTDPAALLHEIAFDWRGNVLLLTLWRVA